MKFRNSISLPLRDPGVNPGPKSHITPPLCCCANGQERITDHSEDTG